MPTVANPCSGAPIALPAGEVSTRAFLDALADHGRKALVFAYEGRDVLPSYHVTEVKVGHFASLDCGVHPESWREVIIQLWDIPGKADGTHLSVSKFLAIMGKIAKQVPFDPDAKLTFEVSDGVRAIQLFTATSIKADDQTVRVLLARRSSSCKPRDRWLEQQKTPQTSCSDLTVNTSPCCT
jgi:hypothetical protein